MGKKLNKSDIEKRGIEYRYAFSLGYQQGLDDAVPMKAFAKTLVEIGDPKIVKKVQKWACEEQKKAKARAQNFSLPKWIKNGKTCEKPDEVMCNLGFACDGCPYNPENPINRLLIDLMAQIDNPALSIVEETCAYLEHPEQDVFDKKKKKMVGIGRCYCGVKKYQS